MLSINHVALLLLVVMPLISLAQYNLQKTVFPSDEVACNAVTGEITRITHYVAPLYILITSYAAGFCTSSVSNVCVAKNGTVELGTCSNGAPNPTLVPIPGGFFDNFKFASAILSLESKDCTFKATLSAAIHLPLKGTSTGPFKFSGFYNQLDCVNGQTFGRMCTDRFMSESCTNYFDGKCTLLSLSNSLKFNCPVVNDGEYGPNGLPVQSVLQFPGNVNQVNSPSSSQIFAIGKDKLVRQWILSNGNYTQSDYEPSGSEPRTMAFGAKNENLYLGLQSGNIWSYSMSKYSISSPALFSFANSLTTALAVVDNNLFSAHIDGSIQHWNIAQRSLVRVLGYHLQGFATALFVEKENVFSAGKDGFVRMWNTLDGKAVRNFTGYYLAYGPGNSFPGNDIAFFDIPHSECAAKCNMMANFGCKFYVLKLDDALDKGCWLKTSLLSNDKAPWQATFTRTPFYSLVVVGDYLYAAGGGKFDIFKWSITYGQLLAVLSGHTADVNALITEKSYLFSGSSDKLIKVWRIYADQWIGNFTGHTDAVTSLAFSQRTYFNCLISGSNDKTVIVWGKATVDFFEGLPLLLIIGVIIGGVLGVALLIFLVVFLLRRNRSPPSYKANNTHSLAQLNIPQGPYNQSGVFNDGRQNKPNLPNHSTGGIGLGQVYGSTGPTGGAKYAGNRGQSQYNDGQAAQYGYE